MKPPMCSAIEDLLKPANIEIHLADWMPIDQIIITPATRYPTVKNTTILKFTPPLTERKGNVKRLANRLDTA